MTKSLILLAALAVIVLLAVLPASMLGQEPSIKPVPRTELNPWHMTPAPKELPKFTIYAYAHEKPSNSPCEWTTDDRGRDWGPKEAWDPQKRYLAKLTPALVTRCGFPKTNYAWESVLERSLEVMVKTPGQYADHKTHKPEIRVMVAYGVLQTGSGIFDTTGQFTHAFRRAALKRIYQSATLREISYRWAMPKVMEALHSMTKDNRDEYLKIVQHGREYLDRFDYQEELAYYNGLSKGGCWNADFRKRHKLKLSSWFVEEKIPCGWQFTQTDPQGVSSEYRKMEIYLFRRFNQDGIGVETMKYWLDRAIVDLKK